MPTYDYQCTSEGCDYIEEKYLPVADMLKPLEEPCPKCGTIGSIIKIFASPIINLGYRGSTVQSSPKVPEVFKDKLRQIKKTYGANNCKGIEL